MINRAGLAISRGHWYGLRGPLGLPRALPQLAQCVVHPQATFENPKNPVGSQYSSAAQHDGSVDLLEKSSVRETMERHLARMARVSSYENDQDAVEVLECWAKLQQARIEPEPSTIAAVVAAYSTAGCTALARVFIEQFAHTKLPAAAYSICINRSSVLGDSSTVLAVLAVMQSHGLKPDRPDFESLLIVLLRNGDDLAAASVLNTLSSMPGRLSSRTCRALVRHAVDRGETCKAVEYMNLSLSTSTTVTSYDHLLLQRLLESALSVCDSPTVERCVQWMEELSSCPEDGLLLQTLQHAVLAGQMDLAGKVLDVMKQHNRPISELHWMAFLDACCTSKDFAAACNAVVELAQAIDRAPSLLSLQAFARLYGDLKFGSHSFTDHALLVEEVLQDLAAFQMAEVPPGTAEVVLKAVLQAAMTRGYLDVQLDVLSNTPDAVLDTEVFTALFEAASQPRVVHARPERWQQLKDLYGGCADDVAFSAPLCHAIVQAAFLNHEPDIAWDILAHAESEGAAAAAAGASDRGGWMPFMDTYLLAARTAALKQDWKRMHALLARAEEVCGRKVPAFTRQYLENRQKLGGVDYFAAPPEPSRPRYNRDRWNQAVGEKR